MAWETVAAVLIIAVFLGASGLAWAHFFKVGNRIRPLQKVAEPSALASVVEPYGGALAPAQALTPGHPRVLGPTAITHPVQVMIAGVPTWLTEHVVSGDAETVNLTGRPLFCTFATAVVPVSVPPMDLKARLRVRFGAPIAGAALSSPDSVTHYGFGIQVGDPAMMSWLINAGLGQVLHYQFQQATPGWRLPLERITFRPVGPAATEVTIQSLVLLSFRLNENTVTQLMSEMAAVLALTQLFAHYPSGLSH